MSLNAKYIKIVININYYDQPAIQLTETNYFLEIILGV
jgi:hypothetical protein